MHTGLIAIGSGLTLFAIFPYLLDVVGGKTKPRVVSWFTWSLLGTITGLASLADHQYPAAFMGLASASGCGLAVILGWKHGDRKFERVDIICQVAALIGIGLWLFFNSPAVAVIAVIIVDIIGTIPTIIHAWKQPHEETWITFFLSGSGSLITLFIAENFTITAVGHPIYTALCNVTLVSVILGRHKYAVKGMPPTLKEV